MESGDAEEGCESLGGSAVLARQPFFSLILWLFKLLFRTSVGKGLKPNFGLKMQKGCRNLGLCQEMEGEEVQLAPSKRGGAVSAGPADEIGVP